MFDYIVKWFDILREYFEKGQAIVFSDLFNLQLWFFINGKVCLVNFGWQVELDGMDWMLCFIIVMVVISWLLQCSLDNWVVLFIDEIVIIDGKNWLQFVEFCKEYYFYFIFVVLDIVDGFDQYLFIQWQFSGQLVVDEQKYVIQVV